MSRKVTIPDPNRVTEDTPLRLDVAAALEFPDGSMGASGLRREAGNGRLVIEKIAGKFFTTRKAIREMREQCRVQLSPAASGSNLPGDDRTVQSGPRSMSSLTGGPKEALAAARMTALERKPHSKGTSQKSELESLNSQTAAVIPLKSTSPMRSDSTDAKK